MGSSLEQQVGALEDKPKGESYYLKCGKLIAELLGTATLMFVGCMGCIAADDSLSASLLASFSFGLAVAIAVQMYGHISGAHFNACVTLAALILGKIDIVLAIFYFICQVIGALLGYGLLMLVTTKDYNKGVCVTQINPAIEVYQGFIIELLISGFLVSICCAIWDERHSKNTDSVPIRFGLMLGGVFIATAKFTGSSMNPARSLAPAIFQNMWNDHWVYWVAPLLGASGTALFYKHVFIGLSKAGES